MKTVIKSFAIVLIASLMAGGITGCKSIEVERRGQEVATVKNADGNYTPIYDKDGKAIILDKGWSVDYFQHWNWQEFDALAAKAGEAELSINNYKGGADATNLTQLVHTSLDGLTKLAVAVGEAYEKIAGGGAQASTALKTSKSILEYFTSKGGNVHKATVTTDEANKTLTVSDGTTSVQCDSQGNCTTCTTSSDAAKTSAN